MITLSFTSEYMQHAGEILIGLGIEEFTTTVELLADGSIKFFVDIDIPAF